MMDGEAREWPSGAAEKLSVAHLDWSRVLTLTIS